MKTKLLVLLLLTASLYAQEKAPLVTGTVNISIRQGTFDCDLTLSEVPHIDDYFIRLNSGMNVLHFHSLKPNDFLIGYDKSLKDTTATGESSAYFFPGANGNEKFLPQSLRVKYVGKFPVIKDTLGDHAREDWKGNIAFNHNSLRTDATQSAWYPILYDIKKDLVCDKVRYDIEIVCSDCTTLYINGNAPVKAASHRFKSDIPQEMALFCGNYNFTNTENTYILNPDITPEQVKEFSTLMNSYKNYYAENLKLPYDKPVTFIQTTPVSAKNAWLFVSFPSIYNIGWGANGLQSFFDPKLQDWDRPFLAHELGHFYFGSYHKVFNSSLGNMMSEGFTEFIAMKLTNKLIRKDVYEGMIKRKTESMIDFKPVCFSKIRSKTDYGNMYRYVYDYAPLIFLAVESEIGEKQMWKWLNTILVTKTEFTNYDFLLSTLKLSLKNDKLFEKIRSTYFESDDALGNALGRIQGNKKN